MSYCYCYYYLGRRESRPSASSSAAPSSVSSMSPFTSRTPAKHGALDLLFALNQHDRMNGRSGRMSSQTPRAKNVGDFPLVRIDVTSLRFAGRFGPASRCCLLGLFRTLVRRYQ